MTDWYYAVDGVHVGPVTAEYLRMLLTEKRIERDDMVWNASLPAWCPAASVPELVGGATPLFAVANWKLAVMMLLTFGVYEVFWMYKHWKAIRARTGEDMIPLARGFFAIFFFHLLVGEVNDSASEHGIDRRLEVKGLTALFVIFMLSARLPDPAWLLSFLVLVPMLFVQKFANEVNQRAAPLADRNNRIRGWNWLAVILGIPFLMLAAVGAFLTE